MKCGRNIDDGESRVFAQVVFRPVYLVKILKIRCSDFKKARSFQPSVDALKRLNESSATMFEPLRLPYEGRHLTKSIITRGTHGFVEEALSRVRGAVRRPCEGRAVSPREFPLPCETRETLEPPVKL